jgi:hypothetical protein
MRKTRSKHRKEKKGGLEVRANVPIDRRRCDRYCADHTTGTQVSAITFSVQITVTGWIVPISVNSSPNLHGRNDRNF